MAENGSGGDSALTREIEAQVEEWSTNSTEAFKIALVRGDKARHSFSPEFTYPIFGDEEAIFGYKGLRISLAFAAHNLKPHLDVSYSDRFPGVGDIKATDIHGALQDFLLPDAFATASRTEALSDPEASKFTPPGKKVQSYQKGGKAYEIWCASLTDPAAKQIIQNMQILVPLFIEGGTLLQLEQSWIVERWKLFLLYELDPKATSETSPYSLAGYSTSYKIFTLPERVARDHQDSASTQLPQPELDEVLGRLSQSSQATKVAPPDSLSRERISQFIILPPYQGSGHGANLYNTMYSVLTAPSNICELTVEDPNEAFDDMRDVCDMLHLRSNNLDFESLSINTSIPADLLKPTHDIPISSIVSGGSKSRIARWSKTQPRQLARLMEMQTLSKIPRANRSANRITRKERSSNEHDRAYYFWRLYVKQRLYLHNRDTLVQLDREERIEKLEGAIEGLQSDYERLLDLVEKRSRFSTANGDGDNEIEQEISTVSSKRMGKKRKIVLDDEDDDDEEGEDEDGEDIGDALDDEEGEEADEADEEDDDEEMAAPSKRRRLG